MKILTSVALMLVTFAAWAQRPTLMGFGVEQSEQERVWESIMAAVPDASV